MTIVIQNSRLDKILFLDIETVSQKNSFLNLDAPMQKLWSKKAENLLRYQNVEISPGTIASSYSEKAAIFAEFGKVVCISAGFLKSERDDYVLRVKSFYGHDESKLLTEFAGLLDSYFGNPGMHFLSGHNIREFDIPFLGRRFLANGLALPKMLNLIGKKPWETKHLIDTLELWKFGDYKNYISLDLLASVLGVPSPKSNMDGSMVGKAYWEEERLEEIKDYCELDVVCSTNVFLKINGSESVEKVIHIKD